MAKTLADMTAEERADCVGMWALIEGINLAVIAEADETNTCVVTYPQWEGDSTVHFNEMVTPRFDLPRAWTPDGDPELAQALAEGTWEYQVEEKWLTNDGPVWRAAGNRWHLSMSAAQSDAVQYCQTRIVRRRVSPVEVVND